MLLKDKTAVISGAAGARGIGLATARLFADHGARVAILDLSEEASKRAAGKLGAIHFGVGCNVAKAEDCRRAIDQTIDVFGNMYILINNAGITQPLKIMDISPADWDAVMDVNLRGVFCLSQAVIPHMRQRRRGSISNTSSVSAQRGGGIFGGSHYSASKAGVLGL